MARRRRDKGVNEASNLSRASKAAFKAAAVGSTVALFNRSDLGYLVHEALPALHQAQQGISKDLAGTRRKAVDYKNALSKNVGRGFSHVTKAMEEARTSKIKLRTDKKNNLPGAIRNLKQLSQEKTLNHILSQARHDRFVHTTTKDQGKAWNQFIKNTYDFVESIYMDDNSTNGVSSSTHMSQTKKHYAGNLPDVDNLKGIHEVKQNINNTMKDFLGHKTNVETKDALAKAIYNAKNIKNNIDNGWTHNASQKMGWFSDKKTGLFSSFSSFFTGSRAATVGDLRNNMHMLEDMTYKDAQGNVIDLKNEMQHWMNNGLGDNVVIDKSLRIRTGGKYQGKMYSTQTWQDGVDKIKKEFAYTIPGRLFKMQDSLEANTIQPVAVFRAGKKAFAAGKTNNNIIENTMIAIGNDLYELQSDKDNNFKLSDKPVRTGGKVVSTKFGSRARTIRQMLGTDFKMANVSEGGILETMDIAQSGKEDWMLRVVRGVHSKIKQSITGEAPPTSFDDNAMDLFVKVLHMSQGTDVKDLLIDSQDSLGVSPVDIMMGIRKGAKHLNKVMDEYTSINSVSKDTMHKLTEGGFFTSDKAKNLLDIYHMVDSNNLDKAMDMVDEYMNSSNRKGSFTPELKKLVKTFRTNSDSYNNSVSIAIQHGVDVGTVSFDNTVVSNGADSLKKSLLKEAFYHQFDNIEKLPTIRKSLSEVGVHGKQQDDVFALASWSVFQEITGSDNSASNFTNDLIQTKGALSSMSKKIFYSSKFSNDFLETVGRADKNLNSLFKGERKNISEIYFDEISDYDYIKKSSLPDMLKSMFKVKDVIGDGISALAPSVKNLELGNVVKNTKAKLVERGHQVFDKYVSTFNALESNANEIAKDLKNVDYSALKQITNLKNTDDIVDFMGNSEAGASIKAVLKILKKPISDVTDKLSGTSIENHINESKKIFDIIKLIKNDAKDVISDISTSTTANKDTWKQVFKELGMNLEHIGENGIDVRKIVENENVKTLKNAAKSTITEAFFAGRNHPGEVSDVTLGIFNMANRLNIGLNDSFLSLSHKSSASTADFVKNIALKRILPAMMIYNTASYLNYESRAITGTSLGGYAANVGKALDVGARRAGAPLVAMLGGLKSSSIFAEYWTGSQHMMNADEREDWYEEGYSPVRNGSGWMFSSTEMRGQGISYYKPNYWRVAHSNYYDVSVYGSSKEKWKHSIMPSLTHPFSPLVWATDRYWLEKKNFEDRPYPLTGKMFEEGTPWGSVLNATVGRVLKRQKMLPQARRALHGGMKSVDARTIIEKENQRLHDKISQNDDLIVMDGTVLRNAQLTPYGNPYSNELNIRDGKIGGMNDLRGIPQLGVVPTNTSGSGYGGYGGSGGGYSVGAYGSGGVDYDHNINIDGVNVSTYNEAFFGRRAGFLANSIITGVNAAIGVMAKLGGVKTNGGGYGIASASAGGLQQGAPMQRYDDATISYKNLISLQNSNAAFYHSKHMDGKMIDTNKTGDAFRDISYSFRQLSGMYNFMGGMLLGHSGTAFRYANAGAMTSYSKRMWESNKMGGGLIGGSNLEIIRRFLPTSNKSVIDVNPLVNSMPMWIPEQYRTGDPFSKVKMGDARMPGRGYETLNALHPDEFGDYGAFDRFKILGDIAPSSDEYKLWHSVAKQTVTDPHLQEQMKDIEERAYRTSSKYDFFEYSYTKGTSLKDGVISSVNPDGTVTLTNGKQIKMAGVRDVNAANAAQHLMAGDSIRYETSKHVASNSATIPHAIIYKNTGGLAENMNKMLVGEKAARNDYTDGTGLARKGRTSGFARAMGLAPIQEVIAHAPIPFIHKMFFNINSAEESWKNEMVYGTSYATWDHPIRSYLMPGINKARSQGFVQRGLAISAMHLYNTYGGEIRSSFGRMGAALAMGTFAPDAYAIGAAAWMMKMNSGGGWFQKGTKAATTVSTGLWALSQAHNPVKSALAFAGTFAKIAHDFETKEVWDFASTGKMGMIGAGVGLGVSAISTRMFTNTNKMFKAWAPHHTRKKWALDEYFDRLEYIKYHGLYERAVSNAESDGENIREFFNKLDHNKAEIRKLKRKMNRIENYMSPGHQNYSGRLFKLQHKIDSLKAEQQVFTGSKNAKAAVAYRKAMESTIYGLDENSTIDEILSAVPDQYKDHFKAFMDEDDKKKRKRILKYVPKYLENPLRIAWGMNTRHLKQNKHYFGLLSGKKLPKAKWKGWNPNINLRFVKMKTIQNEGMLNSDFGFYDTEKAKAAYQAAPGLSDTSGPTHLIGSGFGVLNKFKMHEVLSGSGLKHVSVDVEETTMPGLSMVARIKDTASDKRKVATYDTLNALKVLPFI